MQFFVDTAEIADIRKLYDMGLLDGVTTNPSLVAKSGRDFKDVIKEICSVVPGPWDPLESTCRHASLSIL